jgi:hypothetical protein
MYAAAIHRPSLITPSPEDARPFCADRVLGRELSPCLPVRRQGQAGDRGQRPDRALTGMPAAERPPSCR